MAIYRKSTRGPERTGRKPHNVHSAKSARRLGESHLASHRGSAIPMLPFIFLLYIVCLIDG
jgi:hypothetical protein